MRILTFSDCREQEFDFYLQILERLVQPVDFIDYPGDDIDGFANEDGNAFT